MFFIFGFQKIQNVSNVNEHRVRNRRSNLKEQYARRHIYWRYVFRIGIVVTEPYRQLMIGAKESLERVMSWTRGRNCSRNGNYCLRSWWVQIAAIVRVVVNPSFNFLKDFYNSLVKPFLLTFQRFYNPSVVLLISQYLLDYNSKKRREILFNISS